MKFHKVIPYKLKRLIPMAMIAGMPLLTSTSCEKDPIPTRDVEYTFDTNTADEKFLNLQPFRDLANDKTIRYIYLVPTGTWGGLMDKNITIFRQNALQPAIEISPKIKGKGDFNFHLGEASKVPADSLWYVQQGWTINKKYQK